MESSRLQLITPYGKWALLGRALPVICYFQQVFKSDDPLDSKDFNPVDYINSIFPTEQVCFDWVSIDYVRGEQYKDYVKQIIWTRESAAALESFLWCPASKYYNASYRFVIRLSSFLACNV